MLINGLFTTTNIMKLNSIIFLKNVASLLLTLTVSQTIIAQDTTENVGCNFDTPRNTPMPVMNYRSYNTDPTFTGSITVIGQNGPDLSSYRKLDIAYTNNQLVTFFFQTNDTSQQVDLIPNTVHTFDQVNPEITLSNTGIENFDGSYYVNIVENDLRVDLHDFVMVSKTGDFTIFFSSLDEAPECDNVENFTYNETVDGELSTDNNAPTILEFTPGNNRVTSTQSEGQPNFFTFQIPEGYQLSQLFVEDYVSTDALGFIGINEGSTISTSIPIFIGGLTYGAVNIGEDILPAMGADSNPAAFSIIGFGFTPPLLASDYTIWLNQTGDFSTSVLNFVVTADENTLSVTTNEIENGVVLKQNYPNPFDNTTTIEYSLTNASNVKLDVYNMQGQLVKSFDNGIQNPGDYTLTFDLDKMSSGVYVSVLVTDEGSQKQLIVLDK